MRSCPRGGKLAVTQVVFEVAILSFMADSLSLLLDGGRSKNVHLDTDCNGSPMFEK